MSVQEKIHYLVITDFRGINTLLVSSEKSVTIFYKILRNYFQNLWKLIYFYLSMNIQAQTLVLNNI